MASLERNNKILLELMQKLGNNVCADCGSPEPDWASYTLGIFVCLNCSGLHRNIPSVSRVKSVRLDFWDDTLVESMRKRGNLIVKAFYEKIIPDFYYQPQQEDCVMLKDQWIQAKYERKEFTAEATDFPQAYMLDPFEIVLWKKGKKNKQFLKRNFFLSQKDFTLRYFVKEDCKVPKNIISMKDLNAVFKPEKIGHAHGLQISFLHNDERTRNIFVYHENAQFIVSFFNALRKTRLAYLQRKNPTVQVLDLIPQLTRPCLMEGYMEKTGPTQREPFKKRWFTLCSMNRKLLYFKTPLDATELGAVFIGTEGHSYSVSELSGRSSRGGRWHWGIILQTPRRQFVFMCEEEHDQHDWLNAFRKVISLPMSAEDYANEASLRRVK
ncbi:arf-GAP with dual PH domain-containing protein 2-like [Eucyclogobius newberryi]|uniref:arf-GAP with dual PH domain-containing protein 2-like n=1 Tax=Eucyclogobius newberryi TaxID=166745 RepID=UPI003B5C76BF